MHTCKDLTRRQASELLRGLGQQLAQAPGSRLTADQARRVIEGLKAIRRRQRSADGSA